MLAYLKKNILLYSTILVLLFGIFQIFPAIAQVENTLILLTFSPSVVDAGKNSYPFGYIHIIDIDGNPILASKDLTIELTSSNPDIVSVPSEVVLPVNNQYVKFNVDVSDIEGDSQISATFQGQEIINVFRVGGISVSVPLTVDLAINTPSDKMHVHSQMPISVFFNNSGNVLQAPKVIPILKPSQSATFTLEYELKGAQGGEVSFTTNATAKRNEESTNWSVFSNNSTVTIRMTDQSGDDIAGGEIRQKPEIFLVFPNPAGTSENDNDKVFWGAIIINPTNQTVTIDRVTIQMVTPEQGGSAAQIIANGELVFDEIEPAGEGVWTVPEQNLLVWTQDDLTDPLTIFPQTAQEFVIKVRTRAGSDMASFIVASNAHTTMGQFSTVAHTSAVKSLEEEATMINVYPTSLDVSGSGLVTDLDDSNIDAVNTIDSLEIDNVFNVTIREGKTKTVKDSYIPAWGSVTADKGAKLIMKLPPGFPKLNVVCCNPDGSNFPQTGFLIDSTSPRFVEFRDGSTQIEVKIGSDLGDVEGVERFTFQYSLDAPKIKKDQLYIYYIFANGRDVHDTPIGPVSESVVLRIVGLESECFGKQGQLVLQESNGVARVCE